MQGEKKMRLPVWMGKKIGLHITNVENIRFWHWKDARMAEVMCFYDVLIKHKEETQTKTEHLADLLCTVRRGK